MSTPKIIYGPKQKQPAPPPLPKQKQKRTGNRWKRFEDWAFKMTGWKRQGHILRGVSCADLSNEMFSLDCTIGKFTKKLEREMSDAEGHKKPGQIAVVWLAPEEGKDFKRGLAIVRIGDFIVLHV